MSEESIKALLIVMDEVLTSLAEVVSRINARELEEEDPVTMLNSLAKPMLTAVRIELKGIQVKKELVIKDYRLENRKKEIVKVFKIEEIKPNTRLIIEPTIIADQFKIELSLIFFVNGNNHIFLESFSIDRIEGLKSWSSTIKNKIEKLQPFWKGLITSAITKVIEILIQISGK